jgi:excisionase family DNA binding protein
MPVQNDSPLFTVQEVADALGCTGARVRQMLIDGEIKGKKISKAPKAVWLIPKEEVAEAKSRERRNGGRPRIGD